jgi:hypothetical protein
MQVIRPQAPQVLVRDLWVPEDLKRKIAAFNPRSDLGRIVRECFKYLPAEQVAELIDRVSSVVVVESQLELAHYGARKGLRFEHDLGVVCRKVVTNNGVGFIVDAFQNLVEVETMKYHGLGTGTNAEAAADSALQTELTTEYNPNSTRATGTTTESASNAYRTVATNTLDGAAAVTEHGVFSASSAGVLLDRSVFSVVNLAASDSLESTYTLTFTAGG